MRMFRLSAAFIMAMVMAMAMAVAGCGGAKKAYVPVDSALLPWEAPEGEEWQESSESGEGEGGEGEGGGGDQAEPPAEGT